MPIDLEHEDPTSHQVEREEKKFPVIEIFGPTIQGEGIMAGVKTMFVRFGGCDYRCTKCDSLHAVIPQAIKKYATYMTTQEIWSQLVRIFGETGVNWVTFSGGNPAMHQLSELVQALNGVGIRVAVETQGTVWDEYIAKCQVVTVSPKTPGMGEKFELKKFINFLQHLREASVATCIKVVVFSQQDLELALEIGEYATEMGVNENAFYLSLGNPYTPELTEDFDLDTNAGYKNLPKIGAYGNKSLQETLLTDYKVLAEDILQDPRFVNWRFLPQLHVLVWNNDTGR